MIDEFFWSVKKTVFQNASVEKSSEFDEERYRNYAKSANFNKNSDENLLSLSILSCLPI